MPIVSDIRKFKDTVEVSLDGTLWLRLCAKHYARLPLTPGESIDPEAYIEQQSLLQENDCYEAALSLLDYATQSSAALCTKLCRKGYVRPIAEKTIRRLVKNHLLDDQLYAERIVQSQINKPIGAYRVKCKLAGKQLPADIIEAVMDKLDARQQLNACKAASEKLSPKYAALPKRERLAKLSQALARRGFSWNDIQAALESNDDVFDDVDN